MDHLSQLARAYREHAPTLRGQAAGMTMIMVPAVTHPLPLNEVLHTVVQLLAVLVGAAGAVVVFGGLALRTFLDPRRSGAADDPGPALSVDAAPSDPAPSDPAPSPAAPEHAASDRATSQDPAAQDPAAQDSAAQDSAAQDSAAQDSAAQDSAVPGPAGLDAVLLAVPHARIAWVCMVLVSLGLVAGAVWCLGLIFAHDLGEHLADAVMLALPAAALGWAAWRARVMWAAPAW